MSARRQVRVAPSFFDRLDELLPAERTSTGTPSTADFLLHELPPLMDGGLFGIVNAEVLHDGHQVLSDECQVLVADGLGNTASR